MAIFNEEYLEKKTSIPAKKLQFISIDRKWNSQSTILVNLIQFEHGKLY